MRDTDDRAAVTAAQPRRRGGAAGLPPAGRGPGRLAAARRLTARALAPAGEWVVSPSRMRALRHLPLLPGWWPQALRRRPPVGGAPWPDHALEPPRGFERYAGVERDEAAADEASAREPLQDFTMLHWEAVNWQARKEWRSMLPAGARLMRAVTRVAECSARQPLPGEPRGGDDPELSHAVRAEAARLGLSAVGFAAFDARYTFAQRLGDEVGGRVVVCVLEQPWAPTQQIPSARSEEYALRTYAELMNRSCELADFLKRAGYRARPHEIQGRSVVIHYAVAAGLGQLGLNGQLLTVKAGSRCRITVIDTDAPLVPDEPRDLGVPALCDACKICVRRCPAGAIPTQRRWHRGVNKAKINTARCFPTAAQVDGCAVCMKVCPVQRYGLEPVLSHLADTGEVLGAGSDELEGYDWPLDGLHYGPGARPSLPREFFEPSGITFDWSRTSASGGGNRLFR